MKLSLDCILRLIKCILLLLLLLFDIINFVLSQVFNGNFDPYSPVTNVFPYPVEATGVKIRPVEWNNKIGLRLDVLVCEGTFIV